MPPTTDPQITLKNVFCITGFSRVGICAAPWDAESSERGRFYREYWDTLARRYADESHLFRSGKPSQTYWRSFGLGRSHFFLTGNIRLRERALRVACETSSEQSEAFYRLLEADKATIENELGLQPVWDARPGKVYKYIYLQKTGVDAEDRSDWPNQHAWFREKLELFHKVFSPRVKALDASDWQPEDESPS